jgi:hypothetical protein
VLASNESSTVGWTKDLLHLEDFGLDALPIKVENPFWWLLRIFFDGKFRKRIASRNTRGSF